MRAITWVCAAALLLTSPGEVAAVSLQQSSASRLRQRVPKNALLQTRHRQEPDEEPDEPSAASVAPAPEAEEEKVQAEETGGEEEKEKEQKPKLFKPFILDDLVVPPTPEPTGELCEHFAHLHRSKHFEREALTRRCCPCPAGGV